MKKIIAFLFLLFTPFLVKAADVEIKSITEIGKTGDVVVNSDPTFDGMKINFDLAFTNVEDSVTYKVVIKNNTKEDLEIERDAQYGKDNYIKYEASFTDGTNVIKGNSEKEITIKASYDKEIPVEAFDNGVYNEKGTVSISFVGEKENPGTAVFIPIAIITVSVVSIIAIILAKHGMKKISVSIVILTLIALPVIGNALRKISFDIEAKIFIQDRCYTLDTTIGSFEEGKETKKICVQFTENKYRIDEFYTVQWGERKLDTDNLILNVSNQYFTEDSYVKVYDTNDKLLVEITNDNFPKPLLHVKDVIYFGGIFRITKSVGNLDRDDVRVEISSDLEAYDTMEVYHFMYSGKPGSYTVNGPWIADEATMNKVFYLETFNTDELVLKGFERDAKDSHLYHAVWGAPDIIK